VSSCGTIRLDHITNPAFSTLLSCNGSICIVLNTVSFLDINKFYFVEFFDTQLINSITFGWNSFGIDILWKIIHCYSFLYFLPISSTCHRCTLYCTCYSRIKYFCISCAYNLETNLCFNWFAARCFGFCDAYFFNKQ